MSSTSSAALAVSVSDSKERECEPSRSAKSNRSSARSLPSTGQKSPVTTTSQPLPLNASAQMEFPLMSSVEASLAKTSVSRERELGLMESAAGYGETTPDSLASYDPNTSSWKTSQLCLDGGLAEFSETWPRSGMMRSGTLYPLPTLVPHISVNASGLWQTPVADDKIQRSAGKWNGRGEPKLSGQVKLWPTPAGPNDTGGAVGLGGGAGNRNKLYAMLGYEAGKKMMCGTLNAHWVEWLMGFPITWTALEHSETRSSRKSRKSSDGQS